MSAYEDLSSNSFESICRTCLMHHDLFVIDEISWERMDLKDVITYCCLQLESDDRLPNQMCRNCIRKMYETYQFLCKCRYSEKVLRKILLSESIKSENEESREADLEPVATELDNKHEISFDYHEINGDITDVKDIVEESQDLDALESDHDIDADDPVEFESKLSNAEDTENCLLDKTNTIKEQINNKIRVKNKLRLRQLAKAQLMRYNNLPTNRQQKNPYVFRKGPPYICMICKASYQTHKELNQHKFESKHKRYYKYECEYCGKMLSANSKQGHIRTHTGEKPHKCPTCGKCFNFKADVKRHMVMHMEVKPYACRFCGKGFTRNNYRLEHERIHTGQQLLCSFCGKRFHSYSTLTSHEKTHRGLTKGSIRTSLANDKLYQCHLCGKVLHREYTLKAHILLHGPKNLSCEICGKTFISNSKLQAHIKMTHQDKKYSCHMCRKEYKQKSTLDDHLKSHSGKNYPCNECGKKFACRSSLTQHRRKHTGDTKYQCQECLYICLNRRQLEIHVRTHTGEKPFACTYCGKCFAQKANMKAHTEIHANQKNHACKLCDKVFSNRRGFNKHMTVHEKNGEDGNIDSKSHD